MSPIVGTSNPPNTSPSAVAARRLFFAWGDVVVLLESFKSSDLLVGMSRVRPAMTKKQVWRALWDAAKTFHPSVQIDWRKTSSLTALNTYREFVDKDEQEGEVAS